jgi:hypothetical protein
MSDKQDLRAANYKRGLNKALYDLNIDQFDLNQYRTAPLHVQIDKVQALLGNDWLVVISHD